MAAPAPGGSAAFDQGSATCLGYDGESARLRRESARAVSAGGRYRASEMEEGRTGNDAALSMDSFRFVARGVLLAPMIGKNETDRASSGRRRLVI